MSFHQLLSNKIVESSNLLRHVRTQQLFGRKVVFTNGCFDILHPGHVHYLAQARDLGSMLIVGLNTDHSVKTLNKGAERPINSEASRAKILAALTCVDYVIFFNDETPLELITYLQPDILVKGNDYEAEKVIGFDVVKAKGGQVITIPLLEGFSTTKLIEKLSQK
jgi:D-glycero-beta-D-manno-heptose 1-phosphate adenylyltransferase